MGEFVHDPRHRYSYELRPDAALDAAIRTLASSLEEEGLLPTGASTAPRFQPHLTLLRADHVDTQLVARLAERVAVRADVDLAQVGTFGGGRIVWVAPARATLLESVRIELVANLGAEHVDPLSLARSPWLPHVTVAYAVDQPHRDAVVERVSSALPLRGRWQVAQSWDLDVRPTRLAASAAIAR